MKEKYVFLNKIVRNLKLILCAYTFRQNLYLKINDKIPLLFNMTSKKER